MKDNRGRVWQLGRTFLLIVGVLFPLASSLAVDEKPNVVLVFADDQGWKDVGYQSDGKFLTPNIDRMAREGMVFTDAYAAAGNCAPSRACLLSGNYTPRHHVYAVNSTSRGPENIRRLIPIPNRSGLGRDVLTIAEALKEAGYATGHFGKWHLAGKDGVERIGCFGRLDSGKYKRGFIWCALALQFTAGGQFVWYY